MNAFLLKNAFVDVVDQISSVVTYCLNLPYCPQIYSKNVTTLRSVCECACLRVDVSVTLGLGWCAKLSQVILMDKLLHGINTAQADFTQVLPQRRLDGFLK